MKSLMPTRKWFAALATGLLAVFSHFLATGEFDSTERGGLVTLAIALVGAYLKSNESTDDNTLHPSLRDVEVGPTPTHDEGNAT